MIESLMGRCSRTTFVALALAMLFLATGAGSASPPQVAAAQPAVGDSAATDSTQAIVESAREPQPVVVPDAVVSEGLAAEIDTLYHDLQALESRVLDVRSKMLQFSAALERKESLVTSRESEVSSRAGQLTTWEQELNGRERNLNTLKYFSLAGLLISLILFVTGYFTLRTGKKRLRQATAQASQSNGEPQSTAHKSEMASPAGE